MSLYRLQFTVTLVVFLAREQALRGALAAGPEKEGELATTSLELEYLHRKSRCEMLIGGDDTGNDVITLGASFNVFFNVCLHSRSFPLRADWRSLTAQSAGTTGELEAEFKFQRCSSFSRPAARALRRACSQAVVFHGVVIHLPLGERL